MFRSVVGARELKVRLGTHLRRVREGPLTLGSLAEGHVRALSEAEVERLRA